MKKSLLIGIAALAVLSLWLVFTFSRDSSVVTAALAGPAYADNGGRGCTDACLYDVEVVQQIPLALDYCKIGLGVKHKSYEPDNCCCHAADHILVEIRTTQGDCDCDVPWICTKQYSVPGVPCGYDFYTTPLFAVPDDVRFYYKFWDLAASSSCIATGNYLIDCQ